jgi:holo-[acyl-carrier protein] synthase
VKIGIDVVELDRFKRSLTRSGNTFLNNHFSKTELQSTKPEHLAGMFAAKEAIFKTGFIKKIDFLSLQILKDKHGQPKVFNRTGVLVKNIEVSISHSKNIVVAVAIYGFIQHK